jgi:hypothetical protein
MIYLKNAGQKGLGMCAKVNILRGTRVITEPPLLKFDQVGNAMTIWKSFKKLKVSEKKKYLGLYYHECDWDYELMNPALWNNSHRYEITKVLAIYKSNKSICHTETTVVSYLPSRFNHSMCRKYKMCGESEFSRRCFDHSCAEGYRRRRRAHIPIRTWNQCFLH